MIIGGAEERKGQDPEEGAAPSKTYEVLKNLLPEERYDNRIEVVTCATSVPEEFEKIYEKTFEEIGYTNFGFLHAKDKIEARNGDLYKRIEHAQTVFFTGGDQLTLSTILAGTDMIRLIKQKYQEERDFLVAGTSAGAMALSTTMIASGGVTEALLGADIQTASGLAFIENCIIDTHFIKRGRFSRLAHAIVLNPGNLGIGLGEDAALLICKGDQAKCIGSGMVILIDGSDIRRTNISEATSGDPIYIENLRVHFLVEGCEVSLKNRELKYPA